MMRRIEPRSRKDRRSLPTMNLDTLPHFADWLKSSFYTVTGCLAARRSRVPLTFDANSELHSAAPRG